jgi:hypothetical protein
MTKSLHHSFAQVRSNKCRYALLFSISITWIAGCLQVESFQLSPLRQVRQRTRPITGILSSTLEGHDPAEAQQPGQNKKSLQDLLLPSNACKVDQMSGTQLGESFILIVPSALEVLGLKESTSLTSRIMHTLVSLISAYIGDVVFELYIRSRHVWPSKRTSDLQNKVVAIVRGK